jgi:hypothetical protein
MDGQAMMHFDGSGRRRGPVERAVGADLTTLRQLELLPPGASAIAAAYRLAAREVDRAEADRDRWGKIAAIRELRSVAERLGALAPPAVTDDQLSDLLAELSAKVRDVAPP